MNVVISQPRYLPALNTLHRMVVADIFVYLDTVQYTPRDWENRNKIRTHDGWQWLSVPVVHASREQLIRETRINREVPWVRKQLGAVRHNYAKAPFFAEFYPGFEAILLGEQERLIDLNRELTDWLLDAFGLACRFELASDRNPAGRGGELLIDLCKQLGATVYLSGPLGRDYIEPAAFERAGIGLVYHEYEHPEYAQLGEEFLPYMSALDLLFNEGRTGGEILARNNATREEIQRAAGRGERI